MVWRPLLYENEQRLLDKFPGVKKAAFRPPFFVEEKPLSSIVVFLSWITRGTFAVSSALLIYARVSNTFGIAAMYCSTSGILPMLTLDQ